MLPAIRVLCSLSAFRGPVKLLHTAAVPISDESFRHFIHAKSLSMSWCRQWVITNDAFRHLAGLSCLDIAFCSSPTFDEFGVFGYELV